MPTRLDALHDYPFDRLKGLLDGLSPPDDRRAIPLHIGEPQGACPDFVSDIIRDHAAEFGKYPSVRGSADYLSAAADWLTTRFALPEKTLDANRNIVTVAGTREALYLIASAAVLRKEKSLSAGTMPTVLYPNPLYHIYYGGAIGAGAEPVGLPATAETEFAPDFDAVPEEVLDRAALVYLCNPGNPTGAVIGRDRIEDMVRRARRHGFVLAVDECYSEIWFDAPPPGGLSAALLAEAGRPSLDNVVVLHSLSKRSGAPGLRAGFVAGGEQAIDDFLMLRNYAAATVPGPLQAAGAALWRDEGHVNKNRARYAELMAIADEELGPVPGYRRPEAGFFLWLNVAETFGDGETAARRLWVEQGLKVMPGRMMAQAVGPDGATPGDRYVRIALVHDPETVREVCRRIRAAAIGNE